MTGGPIRTTGASLTCAPSDAGLEHILSETNHSALSAPQIAATVAEVLQSTQFIDVHTHLFAPAFGDLGLWGIDQLLTYHYLEAELFRSSSITPAQYWKMSKREQADLIWKTLFVDHPPVSEAARGAVSVLHALGLPTAGHDLREARDYFANVRLEDHISNVFRIAGISEVVMTNDPLDPDEAPYWKRGVAQDKQFHAVLRLDRVLNKWPQHWSQLNALGYQVDEGCTGSSVNEVRRFIGDCCRQMQPVYMACSLPFTFEYPADDLRTKLLAEAVLPACREFDIPLSLMIGVRYQVNPALRGAGDAAGKADLQALENLLSRFPDNRFLASILSRENQHEFCVYARKFNNLMPFGCWWFLNQPSVVEEITRERLEMLGTTFIPQHSDARILEQVIYKWRNTRRTLGPILANTYQLLAEDGRAVTRADIQHDVERLFRHNFEGWVKPRRAAEAGQ